MTPAAPPSSTSRRQFLAGSLLTAGSAALLALGASVFAHQARAVAPQALRPPGALAESAFTAACVRCGLCVCDCPYGTLRLGAVGDGVPPGTPYFTAREVACEMCSDLPCVKACPTGALDHGLSDIDQARMGLAALVDQENCLNFLGLRCDVCHRVCPAIDKAITLEKTHNPRSDRHALLLPTVHADACTGCGKCEQSCVLPEAAIKVLPLRLARGAPGAHYRLGWDEKKKAGGALLPGVDELPARRPDGGAGGELREGFR